MSKYFVGISANIAVIKFWNISIGGQWNIVNWPNISKKMKISVSILALKNDVCQSLLESEQKW